MVGEMAQGGGEEAARGAGAVPKRLAQAKAKVKRDCKPRLLEEAEEGVIVDRRALNAIWNHFKRAWSPVQSPPLALSPAVTSLAS